MLKSKSLSSQHRNHKPCPNVQSPSTASKPADTKAATCDDSCAKKDRRSAEPANKPACCTLTSSSAGQSNTMWCSSSTSPDRHRWQIRCSRATLGLSQRPVSTRSWRERKGKEGLPFTRTRGLLAYWRGPISEDARRLLGRESPHLRGCSRRCAGGLTLWVGRRPWAGVEWVRGTPRMS